MNTFGGHAIARLFVVFGLAALTATGLAACSGGASASTTRTTSTGAAPTPSASSQAAPTTSTTPQTQTTSSTQASQATTSGTPSTRASQTAPGSVAPSTATIVKTFSPFDPRTGKVDIRIGTTRSGYCWTGSIAVGAPTAYRCMAHNLILDPCFARTGHAGGSVICVNAPWDAGTKLHLNRPLPSSHNTGRAREGWALQLANNRRCVAVTGTVRFVDEVPMRYACGTGGGQAGDLRHHGTHWSADYIAPRGTTLNRVDVTTVWR